MAIMREIAPSTSIKKTMLYSHQRFHQSMSERPHLASILQAYSEKFQLNGP